MYDEKEAKVAATLVPMLEQIAAAILVAAGVPAGQEANGIRMGSGSVALGDGIAIGPRVQAGPGMICIDLSYLRLIGIAEQHRKLMAAREQSTGAVDLSKFTTPG